ncbi:hypothetical protein [Chitinilyticum litopenaei]|uniref:hypothetical protein n=1 Tax=Chitinilyticum litopenaei TaxID=1121276 RepID=UPI000404F786|nr:hypothetical protein [Chitinilyticum litopenaei]
MRIFRVLGCLVAMLCCLAAGLQVLWGPASTGYSRRQWLRPALEALFGPGPGMWLMAGLWWLLAAVLLCLAVRAWRR